MNKATYHVSQKTKSAESFDSRPHLGSGGQKLKTLREHAPDHAELIDAVWHHASHMNGLAINHFEKDAHLIRYSDVNPPDLWGRATVHARHTMAQTLDPSRVIKTNRF